MKTLALCFSFFLSISLFSCVGQNKTKSNSVQKQSQRVNELVSARDDKIWSVFQDSSGNYWFGTNGNGVLFFDGSTVSRYTTVDGLIDNTIRGIQGDHLGNVYIETPSGVSKFNGITFTSLEPISSVANQWELKPNDLWFKCNGNPNDIYRYDGEALYELRLPRQDLFKAFGTEVRGLGFEDMNSSPYAVYGIDKDSDGNLWIGTITAGAFRYDGESFLWIAEKELTELPDGRVPGVRSILEDRNGHMWLSNFISKYEILENDRVVSYKKLPGMDLESDILIERLPYYNSGLRDAQGNLWMTTYGGGVWKFDGSELINLPVMDGETEVLIVSIYADRAGTLWLGTDNAGVFKYNGQTFEKFELEEFGF